MIWLINPFHLVEYSPWPILGSGGAFFITSGLVMWFHINLTDLVFLGGVLTLIIMYQWWRDVTRESTMMGYHTYVVSRGLRVGMLLFILSEVCFFFAFFWAFFHGSLVPTWELGACWPPMGVSSISPWSIPVLNTIVLLASGITITWAHHEILTGSWEKTAMGLLITVFLGIYFSYLQGAEYKEVSYCLSDNVFGTAFFVATGFHGAHVLIGTLFLFICSMRHFMKHFTMGHHFGFEAAAWYWHFVDVVWLFLFVSIYWWGK